MRRHFTRAAIALGVAAILFQSACINYEEGGTVAAAGGTDESFNPPLSGTVYFRSDVLGKTEGNPTPVLTDNLNGAQVSLSGKVVELRSDENRLDHLGADLPSASFWSESLERVTTNSRSELVPIASRARWAATPSSTSGGTTSSTRPSFLALRGLAGRPVSIMSRALAMPMSAGSR